MIAVVAYLLKQGANPYETAKRDFIFEDEDNCNWYVEWFGPLPSRKTCVKSHRIYLPITMEKTFISNAIAQGRLEIIQMLQELYPIDWNRKCCTIYTAPISPLKLALIHKQHEIAEFLMDHGAKM